MRTLIIGLGNPVLTDDAVGWRVAEYLRPRLAGARDVDVELSARGGLELMERMIGYDRAIVIDAMRTGAPPGTFRVLEPGDLPTQHSASGHDVNLGTALELGRRLGARLPAERDVMLIGIEAADVRTFGEQCTAAVQAAVPGTAARVERAVKDQRSRP